MSVSISSTASVPNATSIEKSIAPVNSRFRHRAPRRGSCLPAAAMTLTRTPL